MRRVVWSYERIKDLAFAVRLLSSLEEDEISEYVDYYKGITVGVGETDLPKRITLSSEFNNDQWSHLSGVLLAPLECSSGIVFVAGFSTELVPVKYWIRVGTSVYYLNV